MAERLTWTKLADGDLLCIQHPIRLMKPVGRGNDNPGWMIHVPLYEDANFDDGFHWRPIMHKDTVDAMEARNERLAREMVVDVLDRVLSQIDADYPEWNEEARGRIAAYAQRRWDEWLERKANMDRTFEEGRAARVAARAPRKPSLRTAARAVVAIYDTSQSTGRMADRLALNAAIERLREAL